MKILLLGQDGQVGWELKRSLSPLGALHAVGRRGDGALQDVIDFTKPETVLALVRKLKPDVIVNAVAHTAVDRAESEADLAHQINAATPALLAQEAAALGALLVHYSTDYVFNGEGAQPRDETAVTGPLSVYGQTKLAGELAIQASACRHLIFRTSWVYAAKGGNFAKTMLRLAREKDQLQIIRDQIGSPTGADLIADVTAHVIRSVQAQPARFEDLGLYHLAASGETSWYDYARFVIEWARAQGQAIAVAPQAIHPIITAQYPTPAQRPLNSRLDTSKLTNVFGLTLPHWQQGVERMLTEISGK